ncbi:TetR family transcriptional regulator [Micrococcales bacterium 31B]|nr:TetR family transcriptional regulator [Micrococcales bacterium 31B]
MFETSTTRITKRRAETRENLLEGAYQVFVDKGFGATRIEDVCRAAGYTRGAFYSQFESLEDLFYEICLRRSEAQLASVSAGVEAGARDSEVSALVAHALKALKLEREWSVLLAEFRLQSVRSERCAALLDGMREKLEAAFAARLNAVIERVPALQGRTGAHLAADLMPLVVAAQEELVVGVAPTEVHAWLERACLAVISQPR